LIVPYTLDANDMRFATPQGFNAGEQFESYLRDSFDTLYAEGGRMLSVGLHCRLAGRPGRAAALERPIRHMAGHDGVWFATRAEIAEHWAKTHPPHDIERPSEMSQARFIEAFGGVFEHSPWVAERAHGLELGPTHDSTAGVHAALARAFRSASDTERMAVLRAHPDLAGRLAEAKRLTEASSAEQATVGLDALSDDERAVFTRLNGAYTERFGFPFIIAVRDHDKAGILAAFEQRLDHSADDEFAEACAQVERIAELRLRDLMA
jgi:OHCU decarboxylase